MIDYHIHTLHSPDAEGAVGEYCEQALRLGLAEICFTNHAEMDPARGDNVIRFGGRTEPLTNAGLRRHHAEIREAAARYRPRGLVVRSGIEVGFFPGMEQRLRDLTAGIDYDFLLGSIHCLDHACIDSSREYKSYFTPRSARQLIDEYYGYILQLAESRLFDSLGHIDVYKKYGIGFYGPEVDYLPEDLLAEVFDALRRNGFCLEVNTAGLRRIKQFYPSTRIMELARDMGVKRLTIGSDCHKVSDLGKGIEDGAEYAKSFGFSSIYSFTKRKPTALKI